MKTSLEIAQEAQLEPIDVIGQRVGLEPDEIEPYGRNKAKISLAAIDRLRLTRVYEGAPHGDLFLLLHRHRRDAFPSTGCPHLAQTVVSVIGDGGQRRRLRLPGAGRRSPSQSS